jgi:hypothetical protein
MGYDEYYAEYNQFDYVSADCKIYVPDGTYDAYIAADGWAQYKDMIVNPNSTPAPAVQSQIFYTTTDENIVTYNYDKFVFLDADGNGLNVVSNTYENGQGVITISGELIKIGNDAFVNRNLTSITIPDGVTSIGARAFLNCHNIVSINIPNSVTYIEGSAFSGCEALTSVNIPDGVTTISSGLFASCRSLTSVTIPKNVTMIEEEAFASCNNLLHIYCSPMIPPVLDCDHTLQSIYGEDYYVYNQFENVSAECKIYVPTASVDAYKAAENWSSYADAIVGYDF